MPKAVVKFDPHQVQVRDVEVEAPHAGEVQVRVMAAGVCHSDLHNYEEDGPVPIVMGHEAAGVIERVADDIHDLAPGDHVIMTVIPRCGGCRYCVRGQPTLCDGMIPAFMGTMPDGSTRVTLDGEPIKSTGAMGGWSEQIVVARDRVVKVASSMPFAPAALIGCGVVTGFGAAVNIAQVQPGDAVAVIGCGGVGLSAVQGSRIAGAAQIIAVDLFDTKLDMAMNLGATATINATSTEDVPERVMELTRGLGVEAALDFVGSPQSARDSIRMTGRGGQCVFTGILGRATEWTIGVQDFVRGIKSLKANMLGMSDFTADFPKLVELYHQGELRLDEMVSRKIAMADVEDAFRAMQAGEVARSVIDLS